MGMLAVFYVPAPWRFRLLAALIVVAGLGG